MVTVTDSRVRSNGVVVSGNSACPKRHATDDLHLGAKSLRLVRRVLGRAAHPAEPVEVATGGVDLLHSGKLALASFVRDALAT